MTGLWKKTHDEYQPSAKVVDGSLILSLPDAINPVVWRMELGSAKASALEVKPAPADGTFLLTLKTPKGEVYDIAPYATREQALRALMRVSAAMQGAQGRLVAAAPASSFISPADTATANTAARYKGTGASPLKWALAVAGIFLVIFLFSYLGTISPAPTTAPGNAGEETQSGATGVPQSADEVLRGLGGY